MAAKKYTWTQWITPTTVGVVQVVINTDTNRTFTKTRIDTEFSNNGTMSVLTRTDTNSAGTVTGVTEDFWGSKVTV